MWRRSESPFARKSYPGVTHFQPRCHIDVVSSWSEQSDAALLGLDDPDAFAELYDRHVGRIFAWSGARVGDYAADLTAEVFALAWQSRKRFRDEHHGSALPWLYVIIGFIAMGQSGP